MWNGGDNGYPETYSGVSQTDLLWYYNLPRPNFGGQIEFEFAKIVLSIASDPVMQSYELINPPCLASRTELVWNYRPLWLVLSYSLAVAGILCVVVMGILAYEWNGYGTDLGFSSILVTTRNKALDEIVEGSEIHLYPSTSHKRDYDSDNSRTLEDLKTCKDSRSTLGLALRGKLDLLPRGEIFLNYFPASFCSFLSLWRVFRSALVLFITN
jgi:hypothetical protein